MIIEAIKTAEPNIYRRACASYRSQVSRCTNKKDPSYKNYGFRGISVNYAMNEFIWWYFSEFKKVKELQNDIWTCGRINHALGYEFSNIILQPRKENTKELQTRHPNPSIRRRKKIIAYDIKTNEPVNYFLSTRDAAAKLGILQGNIVKLLKSKTQLIKKRYYIRHEDNYFPNDKFAHRIKILDQNNNLVDYAYNSKDAARKTGVTHRTVLILCNGQRKTNRKSKIEYKFEWVDNDISTIKTSC